MGAQALYDALRHFLPRLGSKDPAPIVFDFKMHEEASEGRFSRTVSARLEGSDSEGFRDAVKALERALQGSANRHDFDSDRRPPRELR